MSSDSKNTLTQDYAKLQARLGPHHAPQGLYLQNKQLAFIGSVRCNVTELEAGEWTEIILDYEVGASGVADGAWIKATFKFYSDWALFQTGDPSGANYISAEYQARALVPGQSPATVQSLSIRFDQKGHERPYQKAIIVDVVDGYLNAGDHIIIRLGDRRAGGPGTRVQTFVEDSFKFRLYVDPLGTSRFVTVPDDVTIKIKHGPAAQVFLNAPRFAHPHTPLRVRASVLDRWGNIVQDANRPLRLRVLQHNAAIQELTYSLPDTGWASVGTTAAQGLNLPSGSYQLVADIPSLPHVPAASFFIDIDPSFAAPCALYADLHVHAHDTVGTNSPLYNARYARDIGGIDVFGYTANDFQITDKNWSVGLEAVRTVNEPGVFLAFPVQEWCGSSTAGGDHNVVFLGEDKPGFPYNAQGEHNRTLVWNEDMQGNAVTLGRWPVEELWAAYVDQPQDHLLIPHVGGRRYIPDWHHPELERLVEIASTWGHFAWLYQDVIQRGYRLGVAANSDEHRGRPGGGAPGVQVFGVHGGLTGVLAERLDRASVARDLRARHTWASTGEHSALITQCGPHLQGDAFQWQGDAPISYQFLGQSGWEYLAAYDHTGRIWERDLHLELGYSERRIRLRWGGARIPDRYRWAAWNGRIEVLGATIRNFRSYGFEHSEESSWRASPTEIAFRSDTYGDADSIEIEVSSLQTLRIVVSGTIDSYVKVGDPLQPNPFVHCPSFHWELTGQDLLRDGRLQLELGGTELFLALERLSEAELPRNATGNITVNAANAEFGFRPVYFHGRQRDDSKVWSSAHFIEFVEG